MARKEAVMELKDYFSMARRWAWLLSLGLILGAMVGGLVSLYQEPVYQASTRILVMRAPQEKTTDYTYLSDMQLVQTYVQLLTTRPVLESASVQLGFLVDASQISVQQLRDTQAIKLTVEDENPQRAADIANIMVQVLIDQNELIQASRYTLTEQSIQAQITQIESQIAQMGTEIENVSAETVLEQQKQVEAQIATLQVEVSQLDAEVRQLTASTSANQALLAEKQARLSQSQSVLALYQQIYTDLIVLGKPVTADDDTTRLAQLQTTLQLYQEIYINLLNNLEVIRLARLQNTPNVVQIESATMPSSPVRPRPLMNVVLAGAIGLMLAGGIAFLIEYIDDTIRTPDDIERILNLPVIGYIGDMSDGQETVEDLHVVQRPRSPISEAFRSLRTNLEFTNVDQTLNKILVTSSGPGEGKTTISANLAAIIAQSGKSVLLIDADMRRPRIHSLFGLSNRVGLSALFRGNASVRSVMKPVDGVDGVYVITSGSLPPNPTELLASGRMDQILHEAGREVDMIIVDSPPSLVADFQVLSTKLDGVVLVIQPGHTHADAAFAMLEQLKRVKAKTLGVVLNKIARNSFYYGGYNYYYPYKRGGAYYQHDEPQPQLQEQPAPMLPPTRQTHVYYPPQNEVQEQYFVREQVPARTVRQQAEAGPSQNEITQPRPRPIPAQPKNTESVERVQIIEILPPLTFTPYKDEDDDYFIKKDQSS
jgi:succinoglycan biosynthesis transport protein ExoP